MNTHNNDENNNDHKKILSGGIDKLSEASESEDVKPIVPELIGTTEEKVAQIHDQKEKVFHESNEDTSTHGQRNKQPIRGIVDINGDIKPIVFNNHESNTIQNKPDLTDTPDVIHKPDLTDKPITREDCEFINGLFDFETILPHITVHREGIFSHNGKSVRGGTYSTESLARINRSPDMIALLKKGLELGENDKIPQKYNKYVFESAGVVLGVVKTQEENESFVRKIIYEALKPYKEKGNKYSSTSINVHIADLGILIQELEQLQKIIPHDPKFITIEFLETKSFNSNNFPNLNELAEMLQHRIKLKKMGYKVSIDDCSDLDKHSNHSMMMYDYLIAYGEPPDESKINGKDVKTILYTIYGTNDPKKILSSKKGEYIQNIDKLSQNQKNFILSKVINANRFGMRMIWEFIASGLDGVMIMEIVQSLHKEEVKKYTFNLRHLSKFDSQVVEPKVIRGIQKMYKKEVKKSVMLTIPPRMGYQGMYLRDQPTFKKEIKMISSF